MQRSIVGFRRSRVKERFTHQFACDFVESLVPLEVFRGSLLKLYLFKEPQLRQVTTLCFVLWPLVLKQNIGLKSFARKDASEPLL